MRTTVTINDDLLRAAKVHATKTGRTLSEVIEDGLRVALTPSSKGKAGRTPLPTHRGRGLQPGVDAASNTSLREAMEDSVGVDALR